jgi:hypothetical protein
VQQLYFCLFSGRFQTGKKNVLLLHDIDLNILVSGKDCDKIKSIARSETTTTKIHSDTLVLPSLWIFASSNMNLNSFTFQNRKGGLFSQNYTSKVQMVGQKRRHEESLNAVKARFIELFIKKAPKQDPEDLKHTDNFQRDHFILGTYERILTTAESYTKEDFHSAFFTTYLLTALCKFADLYSVVMQDNPTRRIKVLIDRLASKDFKFNGKLPEEPIREHVVVESTCNASQPAECNLGDPSFGEWNYSE